MSHRMMLPSIALLTACASFIKYLIWVTGALCSLYEMISFYVCLPICQSLTSPSKPPVSKKLQSIDGLIQVTPEGTSPPYLLCI